MSQLNPRYRSKMDQLLIVELSAPGHQHQQRMLSRGRLKRWSKGGTRVSHAKAGQSSALAKTKKSSKHGLHGHKNRGLAGLSDLIIILRSRAVCVCTQHHQA